MKKSEELQQELVELKASAEALKEATEIKARIDEIKALKAKIELAEMEEEEEKLEIENKTKNLEKKVEVTEVEDKNLELRVFAKAMSGLKPEGELEIKALSSLTDKDGKLLIPADVRTAINTWLRNYTDMSQYVAHEPVTMTTGSRIYEVEADAVPFDNIAELTVIPDMGSPEFQKIDYACNYYKGMLKIPNELLKNEAGGLVAYIAQWIAKKTVATRNVMAFYADGSKADGLLGMSSGGITVDKTLTTPIELDDIDTILNVTLPMAISKSAECRIYTNQTGFNYLLSKKDSTGHRYLQPDVTNPATYRYSGKEIVPFDDKHLQNATIATKSQFPIIVGNLKEAMKMFELENFAVETDRSRYFDEDATGMRVIGALTTKIFDKKAAVAVYSPLEAIV